jgi:membrane fusion protein (multidrug efflux system)
VKRGKILLWLAVLVALAGAVWWWRVGRGPEVTAVSPWRGTAVEIVYATGAVEPVRWAKVTSLIRGRIVELCDCEGRVVAKGDVLVARRPRAARATPGAQGARGLRQARGGAGDRADRPRRQHDAGA